MLKLFDLLRSMMLVVMAQRTKSLSIMYIGNGEYLARRK